MRWSRSVSVRLAIKLEELDRVAAGNLVDRFGIEMPEESLRYFPGVWEGSALVGVVGFEEYVVDSDPVDQVNAHGIVEEAVEDISSAICGVRLGNSSLFLCPLMGPPGIAGGFRPRGRRH